MIIKKLHPRNKHQDRYNFEALCKCEPELKKFIIKNKYNQELTIDFSSANAVKILNKSLLKYFYNLDFWDIPPNYLCPPIPGRADYIHFVADCLNEPKTNDKIRVLDVGVGANCVYPLIGFSEYRWQFIGSDIDPLALKSAQQNISKNQLDAFINLRHQADPKNIFKGIIHLDDFFDFVICNPPFYQSALAAQSSTIKKNKNLGLKKNTINFGGIANELWCVGGEAAFIKRMIEESLDYKNQVKWFSSLVSSKENLSAIYGELKRAGAYKIETYEMCQGHKISRFVAWRFSGLK